MGCPNCKYVKTNKEDGMSFCTNPIIKKNLGNYWVGDRKSSKIAKNEASINDLGLEWKGTEWFAFPFSFDAGRVTVCSGDTVVSE
jgi:hypothetical protein